MFWTTVNFSGFPAHKQYKVVLFASTTSWANTDNVSPSSWLYFFSASLILEPHHKKSQFGQNDNNIEVRSAKSENSRQWRSLRRHHCWELSSLMLTSVYHLAITSSSCTSVFYKVSIQLDNFLLSVPQSKYPFLWIWTAFLWIGHEKAHKAVYDWLLYPQHASLFWDRLQGAEPCLTGQTT